MKTTIKRQLKRIILTISLSAVIVISSGLNSYATGPERETFTTNRLPDYITFNSVTNNPLVGDERTFMKVRSADDNNSKYRREIEIVPGKEYVIYIYYSNNANNIDKNKNIALGTYIRTHLPNILKQGSEEKITSYISSNNARPGQVFDEVTFKNTTGADTTLQYVPRSTQIFNGGKSNERIVSDTITSKRGIDIGFDELNGSLNGGSRYAGYVTYKIVANQSRSTLATYVRREGDKNWQKQVSAKAGEVVEYKLEYINNGTTKQHGVVLRDGLPDELSYIAGSAKIYNTNNTKGETINNSITTNGVAIGDYMAGSSANLIFKAKVRESKYLKCGSNDSQNNTYLETVDGDKQDSVIVKIDQECQPNECRPNIQEGDIRCNPKASIVEKESSNILPIILIITGILVIVLVAGAIIYYVDFSNLF